MPYVSGDEQDEITAGEAAFWRANIRDPGQGGWWLMGYDKAATEAALLLQGEGYLVGKFKDVISTLDATEAAIRSLTPAVPTPSQRRLANDALAQIERTRIKLTTPAPPPKPADKASAQQSPRSGA